MTIIKPIKYGWISAKDYIPGDNRMIQIWGIGDTSGLEGNHIGYFGTQGFWSVLRPGTRDHVTEKLVRVTHWAELLDKPEDI